MDEENQDSIRYAFSRKIMISSVIVLLVVCFVIVLFHVYARWLRRQFRHHNRRRRRLDASAPVISCQGLDLCAMNSLPTFVYESKNQESPLECAVCLSEFDDNETGRILPECKHCFHVDCIDMWLRSHCDCPLCRAQVNVRPVSNPEPIEDPDHVIVSINLLEDMGSGSDSGLHPTCQSDGIHTGCSSSTSGTLDVLRQLTDPMEQDPTKKEGDPDSDGNIGSDIESGSKTPVRSARVLKRLFSI